MPPAGRMSQDTGRGTLTPAQPERAFGAWGRTAMRGGGLDNEPKFQDIVRRLFIRRGIPRLHSGQGGLALLILTGLFLVAPALAQQPANPPQNFAIGHTAAPPAAVQPPPRAATPVKVEWNGGKISLSADGAPLAEVIREVTSRTGTKALGLNTLTGNVYADFSGLNLPQAFQKLLYNVNYALIDRKPAGTQKGSSSALLVIFSRNLDESDPGLEEVMGQDAGQPQQAATLAEKVAGRNPRTPRQKRAAEIAEMAKQGDKEGLQKALFDGDPTIEGMAFEALAKQDPAAALNAAVEAAKSDQASTRLSGLQLLDQSGLADESTMLSMLHDATSDPDMQVKAYAIRALGAHGGPDAMEYLRQALADQDPTVRLLVVQSAGQGQEGIPILQQALADSDESVRNAAAMWLQHKPGQ